MGDCLPVYTVPTPFSLGYVPVLFGGLVIIIQHSGATRCGAKAPTLSAALIFQLPLSPASSRRMVVHIIPDAMLFSCALSPPPPPCQVARYPGQGRLMQPGQRKPQWVDGELLLLDGTTLKLKVREGDGEPRSCLIEGGLC